MGNVVDMKEELLKIAIVKAEKAMRDCKDVVALILAIDDHAKCVARLERYKEGCNIDC